MAATIPFYKKSDIEITRIDKNTATILINWKTNSNWEYYVFDKIVTYINNKKYIFKENSSGENEKVYPVWTVNGGNTTYTLDYRTNQHSYPAQEGTFKTTITGLSDWFDDDIEEASVDISINVVSRVNSTSDNIITWNIPITIPSYDLYENIEKIKRVSKTDIQYIYISKPSEVTSVDKKTSWVIDSQGDQNTWTTKKPVYNKNYPNLFVAKQSINVEGEISCTTPKKEDIDLSFLSEWKDVETPDLSKSAASKLNSNVIIGSYNSTSDEPYCIFKVNPILRIARLYISFSIKAVNSEIAEGTRICLGQIPVEYAPSSLYPINIAFGTSGTTGSSSWNGYVGTSGDVYIRKNSVISTSAPNSQAYLYTHTMWAY